MLRDDIQEVIDERNPNTVYMPDYKGLRHNYVSRGPDEIEDLRADVVKDLVELARGSVEDLLGKAERMFELYKEVHGKDFPGKEELWEKLLMIS